MIVLLLNPIGGLILFGAWISQNHFQAKWLGERLYLEKTQFLVEMEQGNAEMWQIQLNLEAFRQPRNEGLYASAAYNFVRSVTKILAWEESRVTGGSATPIEVKNFMHASAKKLLDEHDLEGLLKLVIIATTTKSKFQDDLDSRYQDQMARSRESADKWNTFFIGCYVTGSALLGVRWLLTAVLRWPDKLTPKDSNLGSGSA